MRKASRRRVAVGTMRHAIDRHSAAKQESGAVADTQGRLLPLVRVWASQGELAPLCVNFRLVVRGRVWPLEFGSCSHL